MDYEILRLGPTCTSLSWAAATMASRHLAWDAEPQIEIHCSPELSILTRSHGLASRPTINICVRINTNMDEIWPRKYKIAHASSSFPKSLFCLSVRE